MKHQEDLEQIPCLVLRENNSFWLSFHDQVLTGTMLHCLPML